MGNMDDVIAPRRVATFWVCGQGLLDLAKEGNYCLGPRAFQILGWSSPKFRGMVSEIVKWNL